MGYFCTSHSSKPNFRDKIHVTEIQIALFIAQHDVGTKLVHNLISFMQKICVNPEPILSMQMKKDEV